MATILCIDDEPTILELQKRILETNGYTVLIAADGATGLTLAARCAVDLVVLDFKMPGMDGSQVAEALLRQQPEMLIVIRTGFLDVVPEWLRWFASSCLDKGDGPSLLLSTIQKLLADTKELAAG